MKIEMRLETMPEYIEREVAMEVIANVSFYLNPLCLKEQRKKIKAIPTADVAEVKHGKWLMRGGWFRCSECDEKAELRDVGGTGGFSHEYEQIKSNYCPNCGAKIDKERNANET